MPEAFEGLDNEVRARGERLGDDGLQGLIIAAIRGDPLSPEERLGAGWLLLKAHENEAAAKSLAEAEQEFREQAPGGEQHLLALLALGRIHRRLGQVDAARQHLESAISTGADGGAGHLVPVARVTLAAVLEDEGLEAAAADVVDLANEEFTRLGVASVDAITAALFGGRISLRLGRTESALSTLERGIRMGEALGDQSPLMVRLRLALVGALAQSDRHGDVETQFDRAMEMAAELGPSADLVDALGTAMKQLTEVDEYERAVTLGRAALENEALLRPGEPPDPAIEQSLGATLRRTGRLDEAVERLQAALSRAQAPSLRAAILSNLGDSHEQRGDLGDALRCLAEADEIQRQIDPRSREAARKRNNLGRIYDTLGLQGLAYFCFRQALELHEEADRRFGRASGDTANTMGGVGNQLTIFGYHDGARHYYEQRLAIWLELAPSSAEVATGYTQMGFVHYRMNEHAKARELLQQATAIFEARNASTSEAADTFAILGRIEREAGRRDLARRHLKSGLDLRRAIGTDRIKVAGSLCSLAELQREEGDLDGAVAGFEEAVAETEAARPRAGAGEARVLNFARNQDSFQGLIAALHQRGRPGDAARAFAVAEASRSRGLLELVDRPADGPSAELVEIEDSWAAAEEARSQAEAGGADEEEMYRLAIEVARADDALNQARSRLAASPEDAVGRPPFDLGEAQESLDERTLLLEYDATGEETFVWAIRRGDAAMFRLPAGARELAEDVRWVIGGYGESATLRATAGRRRRLAEKLLGPVPAEIWQGVERLLVIPDGVLHELPFDLLPFGEDGELLLDRVAIATAPSATLAALLARRPSPPTESARVLVLGDPAPSPKLRLAGARAEAEAVGACFGDRAPPLLAEEATKAAFSRSAPEADIIHLATHGAVDQLQPLRSGLLFRDGLLRTYEIPRVRLAASLVVCSACESGLGRTFSGEGLLGLSRALLGAGARCVVGSLWKVDDQATRALMVDFYDRLLAGKPVAEALREAKLAIRAEHPDPFYWSAFVPTGSAF